MMRIERRYRLRMTLRVFALAVLAALMQGCAQLSAEAARVNWYKVGSYAAFRLSEKLNDKAEEKQAEIDRENAENEVESGSNRE